MTYDYKQHGEKTTPEKYLYSASFQPGIIAEDQVKERDLGISGIVIFLKKRKKIFRKWSPYFLTDIRDSALKKAKPKSLLKILEGSRHYIKSVSIARKHENEKYPEQSEI